MSLIYDFTIKLLDGQTVSLNTYSGKALLIVNTASKCGFTPQYDGLEALHQKYEKEGLVILGFPCNQFGKQEPGSSDAIGQFCQKNYGVSFTMADKVDVNGPNAIPLYRYLKTEKPGIMGTQAIKWNFTKFLVGRTGTVLKRYASQVKPEDLANDIEQAISA